MEVEDSGEGGGRHNALSTGVARTRATFTIDTVNVDLSRIWAAFTGDAVGDAPRTGLDTIAMNLAWNLIQIVREQGWAQQALARQAVGELHRPADHTA